MCQGAKQQDLDYLEVNNTTDFHRTRIPHPKPSMIKTVTSNRGLRVHFILLLTAYSCWTCWVQVLPPNCICTQHHCRHPLESREGEKHDRTWQNWRFHTRASKCKTSAFSLRDNFPGIHHGKWMLSQHHHPNSIYVAQEGH